MITSIFNKTRPINYILLSLLLLVFYTMFQDVSILNSSNIISWALITSGFLLLLASLFLIQFIYNRNNLVKDNMYGPLFFLLFCILFPSLFLNFNTIGSVFFLVLAFRRLISLKSLLQIKQKLFDACVFILIASLFHFWNILFLLVVFVAILIHVAYDFKNWIIPIIATLIIGSIVVLYSMLTDGHLLLYLYESAVVNFKLDYFESDLQRIALAIFTSIVVLFFSSSLLNYNSKPLNQHGAYRLLYLILLVSVGVYLVSPNKSNSLLAYTFFPLSIFGSNLIEKLETKWIQEAVIIGIIILSLGVYFVQL